MEQANACCTNYEDNFYIDGIYYAIDPRFAKHPMKHKLMLGTHETL
jgi:hypothetical protein